jgi:hypothetical protein
MNQLNYNLEKLIRISVVDVKKSNTYEYIKGHYNFWGKFIPTYIEYRDGLVYEKTKNIDELPDNLFLKDNIIYKKSKCVLEFQDHYQYTYWFETYQHAIYKANEIKTLSGNRYLTIN